ncbi:putative Ubiquitin carboxyl-terminal hydrolase 6 [Cocos nucifera]|uniref:ubiquitinyl hydrolase 1 n=1 Tax=Cocos nucifera TaxID=13894 RepID=A0A8K0N2C7_COCNU|nr:putative Ubiquitin carboxyl-terminal hydrolase 6 [Cocos nucifera]
MMMGTADEIVKAPEKGPVFMEDLPEEEQVVAVVLRKKYPQFAQQHNGVYMQQDAEECWTQLMYTLSQSLRSSESSEVSGTVKDLFGIDLVSRIHCAESGEESSEMESVYALKCHISQDVNHLHEGLKRCILPAKILGKLIVWTCKARLAVSVPNPIPGLKSELEKVSPSLGRSAIYSKESQYATAMFFRYLTVQFVRFFWKRESNQKAKILRKVDYPLELDVYELCSDELRQKLQAPRQGPSGNSGEPSAITHEAATSSDKKVQLTGIYDLVAVLTHKGRSADSGHYVAWVKQESGKWIQYDDDNPSPQREEDITRLSGGVHLFS